MKTEASKQVESVNLTRSFLQVKLALTEDYHHLFGRKTL